MNLKLMSVAASIVLSAAAAQESSEVAAAPAEATAVTEESADSTTVAPTPAAETPLLKEEPATVATAEETSPNTEPPSETMADATSDTSKANFDVLRGRAYNTVRNQAAASTIADHVARAYSNTNLPNENIVKPHEMFGRKLVYLEPTLEYATLAFGDKNTYFLNFQNTSGLGTITAGYATAAFGIEVYASIGKTWTLSDAPDTDYSESRVTAGDDIGAVYSMPLGNLDLTISLDWYTTSNEVSTTEENPIIDTENEQDYWDITLKAAVTNAPAKEKKFSWAAGLAFLRHNRTETVVSGDEVTERATLDSRFEIDPFFNIGYQVLKANNARVFLGLNTVVPAAIYDDIQNKNNYVRKDHLSVGVFTSPNILAELSLSDNWMIFGGANYTWNVFSTEYLYETEADINTFGMRTNQVVVNAGARFQYKNFAIEAAINDSFFNNPLEGFGNSQFLASFGGFIHF